MECGDVASPRRRRITGPVDVIKETRQELQSKETNKLLLFLLPTEPEPNVLSVTPPFTLVSPCWTGPELQVHVKTPVSPSNKCIRIKITAHIYYY